ncbi:hypothetical protein [Erwinia oleae]|uniref:hypothetical protein n=1 Tax=Erwinia oleae TaxID=796334 RepID=UPI00054EA672|nr:hypothetical protein [Erwinia oleae]
MVNILHSLLILLYAVNVAQVNAASDRKIVSIEINETGKSEDDAENVKSGCRNFIPDMKDIRAFFLNSQPVPLSFIVRDRYSPCYATGSVEFNNSFRGRWKIYSSGGGVLFWDTGDKVSLFYKRYTWRDPFECIYDAVDEEDC